MRHVLKQTTAMVLALVLLLSSALAVSGEEAFPNKFDQYPGFSDVSSANWFFSAVQTCYQTGLMNGKGDFFDPDGILTLGEVAAIAARMNEAITGEQIPPPASNPALPWYQHHVDYLAARGITLPGDPVAPASRLQFLQLLDGVLPQEMLAPINTISSLPDTDDPDMLRFYNAGILTGVDKYGTFQGDKTLSRAECAAMVARVVRVALRQTFTPADYAPFLAAQCKPGDLFFQGGGKSVTAEVYLPIVCDLIAQLEKDSSSSGVAFNWFNTYNGPTFLEYVRSESLAEVGVTKSDGTVLYQNFDIQVFYSRLLDVRGA